MKRTLIAISTLAVTSLSGCALISDPMPIGGGAYTLHATGGTYSSQAGMRDELWEEATEFCAKQGKTPILLDQNSTAGHTSYHAPRGGYTGGGFAGGFASSFGGFSSITYPEADIVFRCVNPEPENTPTKNDSRVSTWVTTLVHPQVGIQAVDVANIKSSGAIKTATTCMAMQQDGAKSVIVSTSEFDCDRWRYRSQDVHFYVGRTAVDTPSYLVEELSEWASPKNGAPAQKLLTLVCKGPSANDLKTGVKDPDPIHYAYSALDLLQTATQK